MPVVDIGGQAVQFPDNLSAEALTAAVRAAATQMRGANADQSTGAPANVRASVGAAQTPQDRLATIRRFYPDAEPHGEDNFVFNDPRRSNRPTLYNPPGFFSDIAGDLASISPEIGEALGGVVGCACPVCR
jgi:hypothetical protein